MTLDHGMTQRLAFLVRVVRKESSHLKSTDGRLFTALFTRENASLLEFDPLLAE